VGLALAGSSAFAADLMAPSDPGVVVQDAPSGYISVFGGYAFGTTANGHYSDTTTFDLPLNGGYLVGGALGMNVAPNLRAEVEVSYASHDVTGTLTLHRAIGDVTTTATGGLNTLYLLGNLWYDIDTGSGFTPYLGAGVGAAVLMPNNFSFASGAETFNSPAVALAGQLGAGIKFNVSDNISLDLGYRARGVFNATLKPNAGGTNSATNFHYIDQSVQVGLDIGF
jgi:outer membrane autotransporter protein